MKRWEIVLIGSLIAIELFFMEDATTLVRQLINRPPKAAFCCCTPTSDLRYTVPTDRDLIMFLNNSTDPDGDPLTSKWYIRYNGTGNWQLLNNSRDHWGRPHAGKHEIRLVVSDGMKEDSTTILLSVKIDSMMGRIRISSEGCYIGAWITKMPVQQFEEMTGRRLAIRSYYGSFSEDFPIETLEASVKWGAIPLVNWAPAYFDVKTQDFDWRIGLQDIINRKHDRYIQKWADDARNFGYPLFLRFASEMNGNWWRYNGPNNFGADGNRTYRDVDDLLRYYSDPTLADGPERFVDMWRHVHGIFRASHADNVIWVWGPNDESTPGGSSLKWNAAENYWPGDDYVDWIGVTFYNNGYWLNSSLWRSFDRIFSEGECSKIYDRFRNKPFMLGEWGCSEHRLPEVEGDKAAWITDAFSNIKHKYTHIKAAIWFSEKAGRDWRIDSSRESLEAYRRAVTDHYFLDHALLEWRRSDTSVTNVFLPIAPSLTIFPGQNRLDHLSGRFARAEAILSNSDLRQTNAEGVMNLQVHQNMRAIVRLEKSAISLCEACLPHHLNTDINPRNPYTLSQSQLQCSPARNYL